MTHSKDWSYEKIFLHAIIEQKVQTLGFGSVTVNVMIKNGEPILKTLNITRSKRRKYKKKILDKE